ncbi:hypothetical protein AJ78_04777 [Emergomyces pasteurianus Ep9510]|uniref:Amidohydrolase-related domain-containing protein n=1 Tax=Emergomyces pasteurianus Ep9510 TaxID=1447872 RepID=A0A1J9PG24_9EURO|nr:hypothetical protein AJ78_04777 [Emergomyces pasteurianus Ep9510]
MGILRLRTFPAIPCVQKPWIPQGRIKRLQSTLSSPSDDISLAKKLPQNSWDSHMHVVDPSLQPLSANAAYTPSKPHTLSQALAFESTLGIRNLVLVQPSIYGYDNTCLLEGLKQLGPTHGRGVVCFDAATINVKRHLDRDDSTLAIWHRLGVRGVRLNFVSVPQQLSAGELERTLHEYADIIREFGWVLQLYVPMQTVPDLVPIVSKLGVKVCLDHFAKPTLPVPSELRSSPLPFNPYALSGFSSLISLLEQGSTYVKISGSYRLSDDAQFEHLGVLARELMRAGKERLVFATDWPHTRFEGVDIRPFVEACLRWCAEEGEDVAERLFRRNAEVLWDVKPE